MIKKKNDKKIIPKIYKQFKLKNKKCVADYAYRNIPVGAFRKQICVTDPKLAKAWAKEKIE